MTVRDLQWSLKEHCLPDQVVYVNGQKLANIMILDGKRVDMQTEDNTRPWDESFNPVVLCPYHQDNLGWDACSDGFEGCQVQEVRQAESEYHDNHVGKLDPREGDYGPQDTTE